MEAEETKVQQDPSLKLLDFFLSRVGVLMVCLGVTIFSELEFSPLLSLPLFIGGGLGDLDFGETGGVNEVLIGSGGDGGKGDFGDTFLIEFLLSRLGTRLQVGCRTGLPLILASGYLAVAVAFMPTVTLFLELHILLCALIGMCIL